MKNAMLPLTSGGAVRIQQLIDVEFPVKCFSLYILRSLQSKEIIGTPQCDREIKLMIGELASHMTRNPLN